MTRVHCASSNAEALSNSPGLLQHQREIDGCHVGSPQSTRGVGCMSRVPGTPLHIAHARPRTSPFCRSAFRRIANEPRYRGRKRRDALRACGSAAASSPNSAEDGSRVPVRVNVIRPTLVWPLRSARVASASSSMSKSKQREVTGKIGTARIQAPRASRHDRHRVREAIPRISIQNRQ